MLLAETCATIPNQPTRKRKCRTANPVCQGHWHFGATSPIISVLLGNRDRKKQRHTCYQCLTADRVILKQNSQFLTAWDVAIACMKSTRSYVCSICLLMCEEAEINAASVPKMSLCKNHSIFNSIRKCPVHHKRWTDCHQCIHDLRAGTSFCRFCDKNYSGACACPHDAESFVKAFSSLETAQPAEQIDLKNDLRVKLIEYATKIQATLALENLEMQKAEVERITSLFEFPNTSSLYRLVDLKTKTMVITT